MNKIIHDNVKCKDENIKLNLIIYYKNSKTKSMVMRYNLTRKKTKRNTDQANNKIKSWFIDSQYEHSRYIVGVERVQHMDCVEHVEHSLKYVQNVYML